MPRIHAKFRAGRLLVTVRGPLHAPDLRRLEQACGPALEQRELALEVRVSDPLDMDEAARLFLDGLTRRGAKVAPLSVQRE